MKQKDVNKDFSNTDEPRKKKQKPNIKTIKDQTTAERALVKLSSLLQQNYETGCTAVSLVEKRLLFSSNDCHANMKENEHFNHMCNVMFFFQEYVKANKNKDDRNTELMQSFNTALKSSAEMQLQFANNPSLTNAANHVRKFDMAKLIPTLIDEALNTVETKPDFKKNELELEYKIKQKLSDCSQESRTESVYLSTLSAIIAQMVSNFCRVMIFIKNQVSHSSDNSQDTDDGRIVSAIEAFNKRNFLDNGSHEEKSSIGYVKDMITKIKKINFGISGCSILNIDDDVVHAEMKQVEAILIYNLLQKQTTNGTKEYYFIGISKDMCYHCSHAMEALFKNNIIAIKTNGVHNNNNALRKPALFILSQEQFAQEVTTILNEKKNVKIDQSQVTTLLKEMNECYKGMLEKRPKSEEHNHYQMHFSQSSHGSDDTDRESIGKDTGEDKTVQLQLEEKLLSYTELAKKKLQECLSTETAKKVADILTETFDECTTKKGISKGQQKPTTTITPVDDDDDSESTKTEEMDQDQKKPNTTTTSTQQSPPPLSTDSESEEVNHTGSVDDNMHTGEPSA